MKIAFMKALQVIVVVIFFTNHAEAQNFFPSTGNVGVGASLPTFPLHVKGNNSEGFLLNLETTGFAAGLYLKTPSTTKKLGLNFLTDPFQTNSVRFGRYASTADAWGQGWEANPVVFDLDAPDNSFVLSESGNVGLGVTHPSAKFEIANAGNASLRVGTTGNRSNTNTQILNSAAVIADDNSTVSNVGAVAWDYYNNGVNSSWSGTVLKHSGTAITGNDYGAPAANQGTLVFQNVSNGIIASNGANIHVSPRGVVSTSFLTDGSVGIGTSDTKGYKLAVSGTAIFTKVTVKQTPWADYVFDDNYCLPSLAELEQFIKVNKHLPEIPSAKEIAETGLNVGDNQALLLRKIEELTLYIIDQNNQLQQKNKEIAEIKLQIKEVEDLKIIIQDLQAKIK